MGLKEALDLIKGDLKLNKIELVDGRVKASAAYDAEGVDVELSVFLSFSAFLEVVKKSIPGSIDDVIIDLLKGMLEKKIQG